MRLITNLVSHFYFLLSLIIVDIRTNFGGSSQVTLIFFLDSQNIMSRKEIKEKMKYFHIEDSPLNPCEPVNDNSDRHVNLPAAGWERTQQSQIKEKYWAPFSFSASHLPSDSDMNHWGTISFPSGSFSLFIHLLNRGKNGTAGESVRHPYMQMSKATYSGRRRASRIPSSENYT